ncbi:MAG: DUF2147 domain-containing protein [Bacteroidales bacterium]|nr:DUF2147 domain-containing protein [Bacteroidales bacterium]MBQ7490528.1 DUF2147 domain-containing protein [Bacteroidales bacterium]
MVKKFFPLILLITLPVVILAQSSKADELIGYYYSVDPFSGEESQTYIYRNAEGKYDGSVCWVSNEKKKNFLGLVFLKGLTYNEKDNEWQGGSVQYPGKKGTYKLYMKHESGKKWKVRGYWGVSMFGKTMYWYKEDKKRVQK